MSNLEILVQVYFWFNFALFICFPYTFNIYIYIGFPYTFNIYQNFILIPVLRYMGLSCGILCQIFLVCLMIFLCLGAALNLFIESGLSKTEIVVYWLVVFLCFRLIKRPLIVTLIQYGASEYAFSLINVYDQIRIDFDFCLMGNIGYTMHYVVSLLSPVEYFIRQVVNVPVI